MKSDIKRVKMEADRCVKAGGNHDSIKLKISSKKEIKSYQSHSYHYQSSYQPPWTSIQVFDGVPSKAYIDSEQRDGPITFQIQGEVSPDLQIYISEHYVDVTEQNATWIIKYPNLESFTIYPRDLRNLKKESQVRTQFSRLYMTFNTSL